LHTFEGKMLHKICVPNSKLHYSRCKFSFSHTKAYQIDNYSGKTLTRRTECEVHENCFRGFKVLAETDVILLSLLIKQGQLAIDTE